MEVSIDRVNDEVLFKVTNASDAEALVDGSPEIGGVNGGLRPMEMVLAAVATCSVFEIVSILKKQRQPLQHISMNVKGEREKKGTSQPFSKIDIEFIVVGDVDPKKANRAADLAINKYCSAKASLHPSIEVNYTVKIESE